MFPIEQLRVIKISCIEQINTTWMIISRKFNCVKCMPHIALYGRGTIVVVIVHRGASYWKKIENTEQQCQFLTPAATSQGVIVFIVVACKLHFGCCYLLLNANILNNVNQSCNLSNNRQIRLYFHFGAVNLQSTLSCNCYINY